MIISPKHDQNNSLPTLFAQYEKLCLYCENFFTEVLNACRSDMQCMKGCASCCILESVVPLEAHIIAAHLDTLPDKSKQILSRQADLSLRGQCPFLLNSECAIYPVRPIICRTHGLPIRYPDCEEIDACPLNFAGRDLTALEPQYILDAAVITDNLMRFNLAFCMLSQSPEMAGQRIPLSQLLKECCL